MRVFSLLLCSLWIPLLGSSLGRAIAQAPITTPGYDPLAIAATPLPDSLLLTVYDQKRAREVPLRIYLPASTAPAPVVLWSHGLGGSRDNNAYLGRHWAARGYAVVFLQHPGSDESVWKDARLGERVAAMREAASGQNLKLRIGDVPAVLDALTIWNTTAGHPCQGRFDLDHVGMSGHSFGALTTQSVAGQSAPLVGTRFTDPRLDAALPMSPTGARDGDVAKAFGKVAIPWLLMTGTADDSPISNQTAASRLQVFPGLPTTIDRYELVLFGAEHSAFSERAAGLRAQRNPNHHRVILALSTAFWDTHLRGDAAAKAWLHGDGAKSVLEAQDRWQVGERAPATADAGK